MERDYRDENFEEFIKRNADNLRMKAPDRIWENLSGRLSKEKRRFGIGLSSFFLATAVLSYFTIHNSNRLIGTENPVAAEQNKASEGTPGQPTASVIRMADVPRRQKQNTPATAKKYTSPGENTTGNELSETTTVSQKEGDETGKASGPETGQPGFTPTIVDSHPGEETAAATSNEEKKPALMEQAYHSLPWTIESTVNAYTTGKKKEKRFQTQFHFAPTISYRKLSENKSYLRNTQGFPSSNYAALYNSVNSMVTHKPDMGFELGFTEKYSVTQKLRVRAGLQFNVNRYDIKAFQAPMALATIALNNRRTATVDSLYALSSYSNVNTSSNRSSWLQNFSFQISAPVGVELALKGNEKMQFGIAGTVQPTYVLGDRTYMITNDYKSYTQVPWLLRQWNVNTSFETFVSYQSGNTRWQVGPQVRYQLLSSFISNYPVKENLFDFGLKIGVTVVK
jgi:hypothetical protein